MATCGEVLVKILENYGVDTVFGIPGVHTVELYRGMPNSRIRHITPRHEQGAGFMADGYARASGKVAACFIITGPGMTNIATAMAQALADSVPMLVISSVNRSHQLGMGEGRLHEMPNQQATISGVCKFSHRLLRADELPKVLARAFSVFNCQRPGPVHIEIPIDVITAEANHIDTTPYPLPSTPGPDNRTAAEAAELMLNAESPLIVLGGGAIKTRKNIAELAERFDAPVINTVNGKGILAASHDLSVGGSCSMEVVRECFASADVVLAIGTEFGETDYDYFFLGDPAPKGKLIRIDIDAEQLHRNVRPYLAICSDSELAVDAMLLHLGDTPAQDKRGRVRVDNIRKHILKNRDPGYAEVFSSIARMLPDVVIAGDSTQPTYYAWLYYETQEPRKYFHSASGFGTLGYAIPAAVGAKLARPELPVIGLIGDGASQFTIAELASAVEAKTSVIFIVWNNNGYKEIKNFMKDNEIATIGVDIHTPDFLGLAAAFGCRCANIPDINTFETELKLAATHPGPTLLLLNEEKFSTASPV